MTLGNKTGIDARWFRLASAILSMMLIGLYQYSWTVFKNPLQEALHLGSSTVQVTFTLSTWTMTLSQPFSGYIADKHGPLLVNVIGAVIAGLGWIGSSFARNPESLYFAYGLGAAGAGAIYGIAIGIATRWFPDKRGLATGLVVFGFGFGAAVFNGPISSLVEASGYRSAFLYMGSSMLIALTVLGLLSRYPAAKWQASQNVAKTSAATSTDRDGAQRGPKEMFRTHQWWVLYFAFIMTANTGLMVTAQLTDMGTFFSISTELVLMASGVFSITNGVGRIVGGWVSDRLGRERTMSLFFVLQGILSLLLLRLGSFGVVFVVLIAAIGFFWGPIFTFFPAMIADYYGRRHTTVNYGITRQRLGRTSWRICDRCALFNVRRVYYSNPRIGHAQLWRRSASDLSSHEETLRRELRSPF
jgi:OFA family oxalate/formate antiporter-like MFS transporter